MKDLFVRAGVSAVVALAVGNAALGQGRAEFEIPITVQQVDYLRVTSLGRVLEGPVNGGGYSGRLCNVVATHTDANFGGGTYTLQAGFAQGESLAQTYTVPANEWPIKIESAEAVFATSNATVPTTTWWGVRFWAGLPGSGTLVASFSSDDVVLPHLRMNPGTNATVVQFMVDPSDPEQVFIPNNGSNQFTVEFRIVQHNNQSGNPCLSGPPTTSNAFPVTDNTVSPAPCNQYPQLAQPTLNWLFGVNCGAFGCPPNGGWSRFSDLAGDTPFGGTCLSGCRPHGDWVMRATWSGANCQPGIGACCMPTGVCSVIAMTDCAASGGLYQGDGTSCQDVSCPQPQGACCFPNGFCAILGALDCANAGGSFAGAGTQCGTDNTCPLGACCLPDGGCAAGVTAQACAAAGGTFRGEGTDCDTPCPPPNGACCAANGFCFQTTEANCVGSGGTFYGAGVACGAGSSCPIGACCLPDGTCVDGVSSAQCAAEGGTYQGDGTACASVNCPQPQGACCATNGFCFITSEATCLGAGGSWGGAGTTCADVNGNGTPDACETACGTADFDGDGDLGTDADIEAFFACLSGNCCPTCYPGGADFNADGDVGTDADIEAFFRVLAGGPC
jgi:hypothetical protein